MRLRPSFFVLVFTLVHTLASALEHTAFVCTPSGKKIARKPTQRIFNAFLPTSPCLSSRIHTVLDVQCPNNEQEKVLNGLLVEIAMQGNEEGGKESENSAPLGGRPTLERALQVEVDVEGRAADMNVIRSMLSVAGGASVLLTVLAGLLLATTGILNPGIEQ
mmetsp:Transcript_43200/g.131538  ORF Transcript_43200/g.131538 Transcript_43200/m.131538 type:complete len:162 (-) Transcript_43200:185-670(-)